MAGELWRRIFQIGKETTYGTAVAATRIMYFGEDSGLTKEREPRPHRFATGSRSGVRDFTLGPSVVGGTVSMPLSASEIIELLLLGVQGGVTPTGGGTPKLWTFVPGTSLESATLEYNDGAVARRAYGVHVDALTFTGSANGPNEVSATLFGKELEAQALTGALTHRVPDFIEGWETKLYIDAFGGTAGTTNIAATLINWDVSFGNQLARKYFADNTNTTGAVTTGEIEVTANLTFEASASQSATEFTNWLAATKRLVRLEFGQNVVISGGDKKFVTIDIPGAWSAYDLGQTDENTRAYQLTLQYVYDTTNAYGIQIRAQNARSAAW